MNKSIFVFLCISFLSSIASAQVAAIEGAVGFKKPVVETQTKQNELSVPKTVLDKTDFNQSELLAKVTSKTDLWDNPRFVKIYYGQMKGMQQAIDRVQQAELDKLSYPSEEAKRKAKEELQRQTLMRFEDYSDKPEELNNKINQDPRKSLLDMASRISFIDEDLMTTERSKAINKGLQQNFYNSEGLTVEEYMDAVEQQTEFELQQRLSEDEKAQNFPVLKTDKKVNVEKVDDQNALLRVSVGAPKSKKE